MLGLRDIDGDDLTLVGSLSYAGLSYLSLPDGMGEVLAFLAAFSLRPSALIFNIRMGPPGEFIRFGRKRSV